MENQIPEDALTAPEILYTLAGVPLESSLEEENFLKKLSNFTNATQDPAQLRNGIFALAMILINDDLEKNATQLKNIQKLMYTCLAKLMKTKQEAKKYCYGVIDDISDDENNADKDKSFNKYQSTKNNLQKINVHKITFHQVLDGLSKGLDDRKRKIAELEKETAIFTAHIENSQKEIAALKYANDILKIQESKLS